MYEPDMEEVVIGIISASIVLCILFTICACCSRKKKREALEESKLI